MRKYIVMFIMMFYAAFVFTGCAVSNTDDEVGAKEELFYGEIDIPNDLFSIWAIYNNNLIYITDDNSSGVGVSIFDMNAGKTVEVYKLEDYLMSPANCAILDGVLYVNYMTNGGIRKMVAIDIQRAKAETVIEEDGINGLVYSVAFCDNIFSLKHNREGDSVIECYIPKQGIAEVFLSTEAGEVIYAISSSNEYLYFIVSDKYGKYFVRQCDGKGDIVQNFDISYANGILQDSQVGHFQMMGNSFYLMNFSSQGALFDADGIALESCEDWCITTDSLSEIPQYVFFYRNTDRGLIIYEENNGIRELELDIPQNYVIQYAYSDLNNSQRVMVCLKNVETGDEVVSVIDIDL